jgi:hypothetical protein
LLGLDPHGVPGDFIGKVRVYVDRIDQLNVNAVAVGCGTLALMWRCGAGLRVCPVR